MMYPFSIGDLVNSAAVLRNFMENAPTHVPWQDLRYLFGQIMYGGHIIDDYDRLMCSTYLEHFMKDAVLDEMELFPSRKTARRGPGSWHRRRARAATAAWATSTRTLSGTRRWPSACTPTPRSPCARTRARSS